MDDKIISKIKNLLKLSENTNFPEESQTALLKAQEFMIKHKLEMKDIGQEDKEEVIEEGVTDVKKHKWYIKHLGSIIGDNFKCYCLIRNFKIKNQIVFIGLENDLKIAKEMFKYALNEIEIFSNKYLKDFFGDYVKSEIDSTIKNSIKNSFIQGYLVGLNSKFKEQIQNNDWGLMVIKDKKVDDFMGKIKTVKQKQAAVNNSKDRHAFTNGFEVGKNFGSKIEGGN
jgi:hypothetical protein